MSRGRRERERAVHNELVGTAETVVQAGHIEGGVHVHLAGHPAPAAPPGPAEGGSRSRVPLTSFKRRYRAAMLSVLRFVDLKGLTTVGFHTPELEEVFVDVSLVHRAPGQVSAGLLAGEPGEPTGRLRLGDVMNRRRPALLALIGAPGSGKTTLLRHTARELCKWKPGRRRDLPILLYLRDHAAAIAENPQVPLPELVQREMARYGLRARPGWFERRLRKGTCVVLLDGLDEVADPDGRRAVSRWVESQIARYQGNDFVIASRPNGYQEARVEGPAVLQVRGFTETQVATFVRAWYYATERRTEGAGRARSRADARSTDLLERIRRLPALYDLTVNPLLLTMIANVHRERGSLPETRADLYREMCQVVLWRRRQHTKGTTLDLEGERQEAVLGEVAFHMMRNQTRDLPRAEIHEVIRTSLSHLPSGVTPEIFLEHVAACGIIIEREHDEYAFTHQTFQEYLAASHLRAAGLPEDVMDMVSGTWWRETLVLYAAHGDAGPIVEACLRVDSVAALALAFDCAEYARKLAPELRRRLDTMLESVFDADTDGERRRLLTGVLISRHLHERVPVATGGRLCPRPVTVGVYRHFLRDMRLQGEHRTPDAPGYTDGTPPHDEVVAGVREEDAHAFARWVNDLPGSDGGYRLPTLTEITTTSHPVEFRTNPTWPLVVWTSEGTAAPMLGTPRESAPHGMTIDSATLIEYVTDDLRGSTFLLTWLLLTGVTERLRTLADDRALDDILNRATDITFDLDSDRARARARALDLTRGLHPDRALDHARALDGGLAPFLPGDLARDFVRDLGSALDGNVDPARSAHSPDDLGGYDLVREIVLDIARFGSIGLTPAHARARSRALARERDHEAVRYREVRELDRAGIRDLISARARARELARQLDDAAVSALTRDTDPVSEHVRLHSPGGLMGSAFSGALSEALDTVPSRSDAQPFIAAFTHAFIRRAHIAESYSLDFDRLAETVAAARWSFPHDSPASEDSWAHVMVRRLEEHSVPVFTRHRSLTDENATFIRLAALCLAAEADHAGAAPTLGEDFRTIAAGITLLQRRHNGGAPATETILLATD